MAESREVWAWHLGHWVCPWLSGEIFELRSIRGLWLDLLLKSLGRQQKLCSFSSPCVSPSLFHDLLGSWWSLIKKNTVLSSYSLCGLAGFHSPLSFHLLLEHWLLPGTAAVSLGVTAFSKVQSTHFRMHRWMDLVGVQRHFCLVTDIQRALNWREDKKGTPTAMTVTSLHLGVSSNFLCTLLWSSGCLRCVNFHIFVRSSIFLCWFLIYFIVVKQILGFQSFKIYQDKSCCSTMSF